MEFLGKTIFCNFFSRKIPFFPDIFLGGGKFSAEFSPKLSPEKMYEKSAPGKNLFVRETGHCMLYYIV
jgi:hypothetical protein